MREEGMQENRPKIRHLALCERPWGLLPRAIHFRKLFSLAIFRSCSVPLS